MNAAGESWLRAKTDSCSPAWLNPAGVGARRPSTTALSADQVPTLRLSSVVWCTSALTAASRLDCTRSCASL